MPPSRHSLAAGLLLTLGLAGAALAGAALSGGVALAEPAGERSRCAGIAGDAARLACYDAESAKPLIPDETGLAGWVLERRRDPMSDRMVCVISPPGKPYLRVGRDELVVDFAGRGGIARYRIRIDEAEASRERPPRGADRARQQARISGKAFHRILAASHLAVEVTTRSGEVVVETFDLAGLAAQHDRMLRACP
jgi:hypothetical protein